MASRRPDGRQTPTVSVLLPARDAAVTLPAALRSVRRQTWPAWECVIVDDGSRDATAAIAAAAVRDDARFRVVTTAGDGIVGALAAGLAVCRGAYVARMDADDVMHRARLAAQVELLEVDGALAGVGAHVRLFPRAGLRDGFRAYETWLNTIRTPEDVAREAFVECPLAHPTLCLRRPVLDAVGYRDVPWPEDYDLVLRLLAAGHRLGTVPRRLLAWRDGPARLTRTHPHYAQERIVACKAAHLAAGFLAGDAPYRLWGYGGTGRLLARALAAHGKRPSHVVEVHPGRIGNRILGVSAVAPEALRDLPPGRLVASVAGAEPRREIRDHLAALGWRDGVDFVCAA
jgi:glycosyltransferase involved in cell wall biosynthesis